MAASTDLVLIVNRVDPMGAPHLDETDVLVFAHRNDGWVEASLSFRGKANDWGVGDTVLITLMKGERRDGDE